MPLFAGNLNLGEIMLISEKPSESEAKVYHQFFPSIVILDATRNTGPSALISTCSKKHLKRSGNVIISASLLFWISPAR
ncbi:MAG: hypothetical protein A2V65_03815 [Deltaproteobacteria bacterium RBG_13_49_15]|nr:MAG: hypothetical protein A2V65_03815 [Deltaproteobacteria bacterium RBG_13_49_15]